MTINEQNTSIWIGKLPQRSLVSDKLAKNINHRVPNTYLCTSQPTPVWAGCCVLNTWAVFDCACTWVGCCLGDVEKFTPATIHSFTKIQAKWRWKCNKLNIKLLDSYTPAGEDPDLSPALILENAKSVSGKLGGVAGVLQGVHIWKRNCCNVKSVLGTTNS